MLKCCKYWSSSPFRDEILVEKAYQRALRRPVGTECEKYCVPNGTPGLARASVFYRYHIPNGMIKYIHHFIDSISNIYKEGELKERATVKKSLTVQKEGKRKVK